MTFLRMEKHIAHVGAVMAGIAIEAVECGVLDTTRGFDRDSSSNRHDTWRAFVMEQP